MKVTHLLHGTFPSIWYYEIYCPGTWQFHFLKIMAKISPAGSDQRVIEAGVRISERPTRSPSEATQAGQEGSLGTQVWHPYPIIPLDCPSYLHHLLNVFAHNGLVRLGFGYRSPLFNDY